MYTFITSHCLSRTVGSQWVELDISNSLLSAVYGTFRQAFIIIHDSYTDSNIIANFDVFKAAYSGMNITVKEMLVMHEGLPIQTVDVLPSTSVKYARYSIGNKAGYRFEFCKAGYMYDPNENSEFLPDLRITRPDYTTDISLLHKYCLITVNGYIHNTDTDANHTYVYDGAKTMKISEDNRFGILSFIDVGELEKIKIKKEDILPARIDGLLKEKIIFKIDEDIGDDSFMLSLGGYLIVPQEDIFWKQGNNTYMLDIKRLPYIERIMESKEFIDISSLNIRTSTIGDDTVEVENLYSDEVIRNYFTLSQSFFIRIKTNNISTVKYAMNRINTPGAFIMDQKPSMPMFVNHGRMVEYWSQKQGDRYFVTVPDSYFRNYALRYRHKASPQNIDNSLMAENPIYHYGGLMLEISSTK